MTSPYLNRPWFRSRWRCRGCPKTLKAELADAKLEAAEDGRLRRRAELIRGLLAPSRIT